MVENISFETVIIVACICATIILVLSLILLILCCKRHRTKKMFKKMGRLNDQLTMNPLSGPIESSSDPSASQRMELRNSRVLEEGLSPSVINHNLPMPGDFNFAQGGNPMQRDQNVHSSMLSVDQKHRKILYEVVV